MEPTEGSIPFTQFLTLFPANAQNTDIAGLETGRAFASINPLRAMLRKVICQF